MLKFRIAVGLMLSFCLIPVIALVAWAAATNSHIQVMATSSMAPLFPAHSLVITREAPYDSFSAGQLVGFKHEATSMLKIHRITEIGPNGMTTKGDAAPAPDPLPVTRNDHSIQEILFYNVHLGYVWQALPLLSIGFAVILIASLFLRKPEDMFPVLVAVLLFVWMAFTKFYSPQYALESVMDSTTEKSIEVSLLNTSLVPVSLSSPDDSAKLSLEIVDPLETSILTSRPGQSNVTMKATPALSWQLVCLYSFPLLLTGLTVILWGVMNTRVIIRRLWRWRQQ